MAYDLIVIGTGPGGYVCAIRAAQLGLKTAVVEKRATFGGTCLNIGCIPSKALLHASGLFEEAGHTFGKMGIGISEPRLDLKAMMAFKDQGVEGNVRGVDFLFKKNKIDAFFGSGRIVAPGKVEVKDEGGKVQTLEAKSIVIATGSDIVRLKGIDIDEKRIVSSTGALSLPEVPRHLLVIGAGVRRRRHRARAWISVAAPRRPGDGGGIPRRCVAGNGRGGTASGSALVREAGHDVQIVFEGNRSRCLGKKAQGYGRAGEGRHS